MTSVGQILFCISFINQVSRTFTTPSIEWASTPVFASPVCVGEDAVFDWSYRFTNGTVPVEKVVITRVSTNQKYLKQEGERFRLLKNVVHHGNAGMVLKVVQRSDADIYESRVFLTSGGQLQNQTKMEVMNCTEEHTPGKRYKVLWILFGIILGLIIILLPLAAFILYKRGKLVRRWLPCFRKNGEDQPSRKDKSNSTKEEREELQTPDTKTTTSINYVTQKDFEIFTDVIKEKVSKLEESDSVQSKQLGQHADALKVYGSELTAQAQRQTEANLSLRDYLQTNTEPRIKRLEESDAQQEATLKAHEEALKVCATELAEQSKRHEKANSHLVQYLKSHARAEGGTGGEVGTGGEGRTEDFSTSEEEDGTAKPLNKL